MEHVAPGEIRPVTFTDLPTGLVGTLGARVEDAENDVIQARSTVGVTEFAVGSYRKWITFPETKGFYVVIADDDGVEAIEEFRVTSEPLSPLPEDNNFIPTVEEVGAHLWVRTKDKMGKELGTFTPDTRPTEAQVLERIPTGVRKVATAIGTTICEGGDEEKQQALYGDARNLAALATALVIERSYFAEQVGSGRSPYKEMLDEFKGGMATLVEAVAEHCGGGDGESVGGAGPMPSSCFPPPSGIGETCW